MVSLRAGHRRRFATVICMAIVRDVYPVHELGRRMAMVMLVMLASPAIAPSLGAVLLRFGWHSIFFFKATYAGVLPCSTLWRAGNASRRMAQPLGALHAAPVRQVVARAERERRPPDHVRDHGRFGASRVHDVPDELVVCLHRLLRRVGAAVSAVLQHRRDRPVTTNLLQHAAAERRTPRRCSFARACAAARGGHVLARGRAGRCAVDLARGDAGGRDRVVLRPDRAVGLVAVHELLRSARGQRVVAVHDAAVLLGRDLRRDLGVFFDGTLLPMVVTMFVASSIANVLAFTTGAKFRKEPAALH